MTSRDNDIAIFVVSLLLKFKEWVILDDGYGENRKKFRMSDVDIVNVDIIESDIVDALKRLLLFSGNDYISSFFRKGKNIYFKTMKQVQHF